MTGAIVFSWGAPVRGREGKGLEVFSKAVERFEQLAKKGRIHGHKEYFAVTGDSGRASGFMIVEGQLDELLKLQGEEEQLRLLTEATQITENFNIQVFSGGSDRAVQERMTQYVEVQQELGIIPS